MREIVSPLRGFGSPFPRRVGGGNVAPSGPLTGLTITPTFHGANEAPQGVTFVANITGSVDPRFVQVFWNYGDDYSYRYLPAGKAYSGTSGSSIGHRGAHTYRSAGTYNVTCTAYLIVGSTIVSVTATTQITINAADPRITETIFISRSGSFAEAPVGATQVNWSGGIPASYSLLANKRYIFEDDQTYPFTDATVAACLAAPTGGGGAIVVKKSGTGANPVLLVPGGASGKTQADGPPEVNPDGIRAWSADADITIDSINIQGTYDPVDPNDWENDPVAPDRPGVGINGSISSSGVGSQHVFGCRVTGFDWCFGISGVRGMVSDCEATDWYTYGVYDNAPTGAKGRAVIGCNLFQNPTIPESLFVEQPDSLGWNSAGYNNRPLGGPVRLPHGNGTVVTNNRLFTFRSGRTASDEPGNFASLQPALRIGTVPIAGETDWTVSQNDCFGSVTSVLTTSSVRALGVAVFENNYIETIDGRVGDIFRTSYPGAVYRSNLAYVPANDDYFVDYNFLAANADSSPTTKSTEVYSNTLVYDATNPARAWLTSTAHTSGSTINYVNNVFQMNGSFDSLDSNALFQSNFAPIEAQFPFAAKFGSPAYGGYAAGNVSALTFEGALRGAPFSTGSSEESDEPVLNLVINQSVVGAGQVLGTQVTSTGTITFASSPALTQGDITYSWVVDGIDRANGFTLSAGQTVRAKATFSHPTGPQVVLSAPLQAVAFATVQFRDTHINTVFPIPARLPQATMAFSMIVRGTPVGIYSLGNGLDIRQASGNHIEVRSDATGMTTPYFRFAPAPVANGSRYSFLAAWDSSGGLPGGRSFDLWMSINGAAPARVLSNTVTNPGQILAFNSFGTQGATNAGPSFDVDTWLWQANQALDPATNWSNFFNNDGTVKWLGATGVVNGVTPINYLVGSDFVTGNNRGVGTNPITRARTPAVVV